ncbi:hypothetical protein [Actinophytocola xinjiangensis]|uniref:hypothetical protein n=1 Tax=Actinophytocola xinjiangensis TaxID=485602 RepID=UPI0013906784|nr:hypothetical protein [Actinophytocola xinjiangensis]
MKNFAKAAASGAFSVNETGGQALLAAINRMSNWIDEQATRVIYLAQPAPLGSSEGARTMQPFLQDVAQDQEGFITILQEFRESLDDAKRGIEAAMASYQNADTEFSSGFAPQ